MKPSQLISIGLFTMAIVITVYAWSDRLRGSSAAINEAFTDTVVSDELIAKLQQANEPVPTDKDAVAAHQTLLRYIRNDFPKGIKFVNDFGTRFYGENTPLRSDLDVRRLMDNYSSPLQVA